MEERFVKTKRGRIHRQTRSSRRAPWLSAEACNLDQAVLAVVANISEYNNRCKRCNRESLA